MSPKPWIEKHPLDWLLERDNPGVRFLALRDLVHASGRELTLARGRAYREGPIAQVLAHMAPEGYWAKAGPGYSPKYTATVWSLILLSQLGGSVQSDKRIARACGYLLDHAYAADGRFGYNGQASGTVDCLQGNLCAALLDLGCQDARLAQAYDWMARSVTGEGVAPVGSKGDSLRYGAYKCGPQFQCTVNNRQPCAWGAAKVMLAFGKLPEARRSGLIQRAIETGIGFLFSTDPAGAKYPTRDDRPPSPVWWKFGFPVFYITDLLQVVEALVSLGYVHDPRLVHALEVIRSKQDQEGRWRMGYNYANQMGGDFGLKREPNKWVTLRALRVLQAAD